MQKENKNRKTSDNKNERLLRFQSNFRARRIYTTKQ